MNRRRDINGRFVNINVNDGINIFMIIWISLPLIFALIIIGKYFHFPQKFSDVIISLACGDNCTCQCSKPKEGW